AGEFALLFLDADHALDRGDAVARPDMAKQLPVVAGVEAVHARKSPTRAADPAESHRKHGMGDVRAVATLTTVLGITIERIEIADATAEIPHGVLGRILKIRSFRTELETDHAARLRDRLVGDLSFR